MKNKSKLDKVLLVGVIVMIFGSVFLGSAAYSFSSEIKGGSGFHQVSANEYVSANLTMNNDTVLFVLYFNTSESAYLVPSSYLDLVNSTNIGNYAVTHAPGNEYNLSNFNIEAGPNATLYANISGQYNIVTFYGSSPQVKYIINHGAFGIQGMASSIVGAVLGGLMLIVGIVLAIVGVIRRNREKKEDEEINRLLESEKKQ